MAQWLEVATEGVEVEAEPGRSVTDFPNQPEIAERLRELIALESECCSFLDFRVEERGDHLRVELRYPQTVEPRLGGLLPTL